MYAEWSVWVYFNCVVKIRYKDLHIALKWILNSMSSLAFVHRLHSILLIDMLFK